MAVDQKEVNALLEQTKDEIALDEKLGINPKDKYRSESGKILDQVYSGIALDENLKIPSPHVGTITKEDIAQFQKQAQDDAIFKMHNRAIMEDFLKTKGHDITKQNIQNVIENKLDELLLKAKSNNHKEQMAQQIPRTAQSKTLQSQPKKKISTTNESKRNEFLYSILNSTSVENKKDQVKSSSIFTNIANKLSNFFKQEVSSFLSPFMTDKMNEKLNSIFSKTTISSQGNYQPPKITTSPTGRFNTKSNGIG